MPASVSAGEAGLGARPSSFGVGGGDAGPALLDLSGPLSLLVASPDGAAGTDLDRA